jgi:outer membrane protein OmpA-like peptidoglycan-associated protein
MINLNTHFRLLVLLALGVGLFTGCGGIPTNHPDLLRARDAYYEVQSNAWVNENAPVEKYEAAQALEKAEQAESVEDLEHLSYLAERRSQIAVAAAKTRRAEKEIEALAKEKSTVLLEARELEIQEKTRKIQVREREVEAARAEAETARERALRLAREAELAKQEAAQALEQAALARKMTKKLQMELAEINAKKTDRGIVLTLGDVLFEFDRAELMSGASRTINKLAQFLIEYETRNLLIEGHTDSIGTPEYNLDLSRRRAEAVRTALMEKEIEPDRINTKGYGEDYPVASNLTEAGRQQNRRVEVIILDEGVSGESMLR